MGINCLLYYWIYSLVDRKIAAECARLFVYVYMHCDVYVCMHLYTYFNMYASMYILIHICFNYCVSFAYIWKDMLCDIDDVVRRYRVVKFVYKYGHSIYT